MNDKMIDRLKKLLALAGNNSSQEEANLAMAKAQELAIENGIDLALIGNLSDEEADDITKEVIDMGQRLPTVNVYVTNILTKFFDVRVLTSGNRQKGRFLIFIGKKSSIVTAKYIYTWLSETMVRCWKSYYSKNPCESLSNKQSYLFGFYTGLVDKLVQNKMVVESSKLSTDADKNNYAVACVKASTKLEKFIQNEFTNVRQTSKDINVSAFSFNHGKQDGTNCNIAKGGIDNRGVAGVLA